MNILQPSVGCLYIHVLVHVGGVHDDMVGGVEPGSLHALRRAHGTPFADGSIYTTSRVHGETGYIEGSTRARGLSYLWYPRL